MAKARDNYTVTGNTVPELCRSLNFLLQRIADRMDKIEGIRGTATMDSDLDMNGHRAIDLGAPDAGTDSARAGDLHTLVAADITDFTTEAQDAVGAALADTSEIDFTYAANTISATLINNSIAYARLVNANALSVLGRAANSSGTLATIDSTVDGQVFLRNSSALAWTAPTAPAAGLTISAGLVFALANDLLALEGLGSTGFAARTAADTWAQRTFADVANRTTWTNPAGIAGNPSVDIAATYVGQTSITTLGTIATGTWNGTAVGTIYGGTGLTAYTLGDLPYASAANTLSRLSGNTTTTRKWLRQTGDGAASAAPAWDTLVAGDLPTTLLEGDGTAGAPSYSYSADTDNGDYRIGTNSVGTATAGALRLAIDSSGRHLIGMAQTSGQTLAGGNGQIQLAGTTQALSQLSLSRYSADNGSPFLVFQKSRGTTVGDVTTINSSDVIGTLAFAASDGTNLSTSAAQIRAIADASPSAGVVQGQLQLRTATSAGSITTAFQIDSSQDCLAKGYLRSDAGTKGIGYATGAGGTVTQTGSRTTGVTLNKVCGAITLFSAAGSATYQTFTVSNSVVAATDTVVVNQKSGTDKYILLVTAVAASSFDITFATTGGTTTEQPVFNFAVVKAVAA